MQNLTLEQTSELYEQAVIYLEQRGYESSFYENYSGRFMYGDKVPGITSDAPGVMVGRAVSIAYQDLYPGRPLDEAPVPLRSDSMGLSTIYY